MKHSGRAMSLKGCKAGHSNHTMKHKFTKEEDSKIKQLVEKYGDKDWKNVSRNMVNRTPRQCRERWNYYLSPNVMNKPWTEDEDRLLLSLCKKMEKRWSKMIIHFEHRTSTNLKNRYKLLQRSIMRRELLQQESEVSESDAREVASSPEAPKIDISSITGANNIGNKDQQDQVEGNKIGLNCFQIIEFWDQNQWIINDDVNCIWF